MAYTPLLLDKYSCCVQVTKSEELKVSIDPFHRVLLGSLPDGYQACGKFFDDILEDTKLISVGGMLFISESEWTKSAIQHGETWQHRLEFDPNLAPDDNWKTRRVFWYGEYLTEGLHFIIVPD